MTTSQPLTHNERHYLELLEQPGPYFNPKWHDYESMSQGLDISRQEVRQIQRSLAKKGYLARKFDGFLYVRTRKPLPKELTGEAC